MNRFIPLLTLSVMAILTLSVTAQGTLSKVTKFTPVDSNNAAGILAFITVEWRDNQNNLHKWEVTITDKTKIEMQVGKRRAPATLEALKGNRFGVTMGFTGPVVQSDPMRATAAYILIPTGAK